MKQPTPAKNPMISEDIGVTKPAAGVIPTSPATAPAAPPTTLGRPWRIQLAVTQANAAIAAAICVLTKAAVARPFAPSALPALKPNQPNHSKPAPSTVIVISCGSIGSWPYPTRLPITSAQTSADTPEVI